jgi:DNA-binding NtrC family response regulator
MKLDTPVVLVIDRETDESRSLVGHLRRRGFQVEFVHDGEAAFNALQQGRIDCLVTELRIHRIDGMAVLARARKLHPEICAVVVTEGGDVPKAVEAMRQGAADFQVKPLNLDKLVAVLEQGLERQALAQRAAELESRLAERFGFERITGHSAAVSRLIEQLRQIAPTRATVLLVGETGTGKELLAQAIHQNSPRARERYVRVHLGALAEGVVESELFGHERGSFTGAIAPHAGRFELADAGTLFLDEIGEVPASVQVKLLRVLQEQEFERVGGTTTQRVDVRVVAATHRNLEDLVERGRFRQDLYYRLRVVTIRVPPLRERSEDIPLLVDQFIKEMNKEHGRRVTGITRGAMQQLLTYDWPGNIRELKNAIEGMVVFTEGRRPLDVSDLPQDVRNQARPDGRPVLSLPVGLSLAEVEKRFMEETLRSVGYDKPRAAETLGIGLRTLYRKLKEYEIG